MLLLTYDSGKQHNVDHQSKRQLKIVCFFFKSTAMIIIGGLNSSYFIHVIGWGRDVKVFLL